jgi:hypothetical protein
MHTALYYKVLKVESVASFTTHASSKDAMWISLRKKEYKTSVFWLIGLDASIIKKCILNIFQNVKKIRQKNSQCASEQFMFTQKFCSEKIFFVACVKKTKNGHVNSNVEAPKIFFFTEATKYVLFSRNFMNEHKMSRCISIFFFEIFEYFEICFLVMGASTPMSQSRFPYYASSILLECCQPSWLKIA